MSKNYLDLYKNGKFYSAFGDDGLILHKLMKYNFIKYKQSVGFPESAIIKLKDVLEHYKLSYKEYDKNTLLNEYKGIDENYDKILSEALKEYKIEDRILRANNKLINCTTAELEKMLEYIEGDINGK